MKRLHSSTLKRILQVVGTQKGFLILMLLTAVCFVAGNLYLPILIGEAVDFLIEPLQVDFAGLLQVLFKILFALLFAALSQWFMNLCTNKIACQTAKKIREAAIRRIEELPLKTIDTHAHGDFMSRMIGDVDQIADGLLMGFTQLFSGIITIIGTLLFMLSLNIEITIVVVVITPLSLFVASFIAKKTFVMFQQQSETKGELTAYIEETLTGQKVVKAFSQEQNVQKHFETINEKLKVYGTKATFFSSITNPATRMVNGLVYTGVGMIGAFFVIRGVLSVGQLTSFLSYANQYTKPFNEVSGVIAEFQNALASAKRVFELMDMEVQQPDGEDAILLEQTDGSVTFEDVSFSYQSEVPLIENFSFQVKPGEKIAIVGPTGCGKTTLINLLMRFYEVQRGKIFLGNQPIGEVKRDSLREKYGMVLQDTWLKSGTIMENIAYSKWDASLEEVIAAAKAAYAHNFIMQLQDGYETILSEEGGNLSKGQKQLLCIARVMLNLPSVLILDEATSSIDTRTEIKIQQAFAKMMQGRTSFIVAHRLSTIQEADCILMMNHGKIIEQGSHKELLQKNGFYAALYYSQ